MKKSNPPADQGGRPGITLDDVRTACDALREQGRAIGPRNVRLELRTGSYTTITGYLRELGLAPKPKVARLRKPGKTR